MHAQLKRFEANFVRGGGTSIAYALAMALDLFAGIRVRDYRAAKSWYERLLGREPAFIPHGTEAVWELAEHRYLFVERTAMARWGDHHDLRG